ncbi:MAG: hypothetical protein HY717_08775 [Planctomycetes bacterium]|nr:hypothetical protein [Planctomycetota bacterium]
MPVRAAIGGKKRPLIEWIKQGCRRYRLDPENDSVIQSHIIAIAMLVGCVEKSPSPWYSGEWGWVLQGIVPIEPIPWVGGLSLWDCKFRYRPLHRKM